MTDKIDKKKESIKKYIGDKVIKDIKGNEVIFEDDTVEQFTDKQLSYLVTDESQDLTQIRDLVINNVAPDILDILEKHNIRNSDLQPIINLVASSYNETFNIAIGKAFGTYKEGEHTQNSLDNIRISDIKRLKDN